MYLLKYHEYGLKAMILLATRSKSEPPQLLIPAREISQTEHIPYKFLEHTLVMLRNAGLLGSKLGAYGGYYLLRPANQITVGQIIRALDGRLEPVQCVGQASESECPCPQAATCGVRMVMQEVYVSVSNILDRTTLEDVSNRVGEATGMLGRA